LIDVQVQGEAALSQMLDAVETFNQMADSPEVLVLIRGGGSADDLAVFSTEQLTRAIAASRIPTLVAIGHEVDVSLAELAADKRASTPSNAAELLVPDRREVRERLRGQVRGLGDMIENVLAARRAFCRESAVLIDQLVRSRLETARLQIEGQKQLANALSPAATLRRGYAIVRNEAKLVVRSGKQLKPGEPITVQLFDAIIDAQAQRIEAKE
jgi:exodeoxyribonuclease VII large subunit